MNFYFPLHLDGGNRGCEAIAKGTAILLNVPKENLIGLCTDVELDKRLGTSDYVTLVGVPQMTKSKLLLRKAHRLLAFKHVKHMQYVYKQRYDSFLQSIPDDGVVLSTGGDMYCYENNEAVYTTSWCQEHKLKTILWGCSIGEKNLTPEKIENLKKFDLIYVRESLTEELLKKHGVNKIINYPDPAFILEPEKVSLPSCFDTLDVIGLNVSNFVYGTKPQQEMIHQLIEFILTKTSSYLLLIPHVLWGSQSDIVVANNILSKYSNSKRVSILDSNKYTYCQIRYIISRCRFFVGARTHSVISAYSMCVPSLALGYSVKSHGIAKDLGLDKDLVVDCTNNIYPTKVLESFENLLDKEHLLQSHLRNTIPVYRDKLNKLKEELNKI
mgnify:FL=1